MVSEIFGVHEYIADVTRRLAQQGYLAIAPDLFTRQGDPSAYGEIAKLQAKVRRALEITRDNQRLILNVAFNYGGRAEILHAVRQMLADNIRPEDLTESLFSSYLFTKGLPDPDLVIRTSGELRISNFLIWQAAYAEYYPTPALWPDFGRADLYEAVVAFNQRERRFGLVTDTTAPP